MRNLNKKINHLFKRYLYMKKSSNITKKNKPPINTKNGIFVFEFKKYLKGKIEWKIFEEIDIQRIYLKLMIMYFKRKKLKISLSYYKKLHKKHILFLKETYPKVHK